MKSGVVAVCRCLVLRWICIEGRAKMVSEEWLWSCRRVEDLLPSEEEFGRLSLRSREGNRSTSIGSRNIIMLTYIVNKIL